MVAYGAGLRESIERQSPLARARWLVALGTAVDALAVTILIALTVRTTVMGDAKTPPGLVGPIAGLAFARLAHLFWRESVGRRARLLAALRSLALAIFSAAAFYALDVALFP